LEVNYPYRFLVAMGKGKDLNFVVAKQDIESAFLSKDRQLLVLMQPKTAKRLQTPVYCFNYFSDLAAGPYEEENRLCNGSSSNCGKFDSGATDGLVKRPEFSKYQSTCENVRKAMNRGGKC